MLLRALAVPEAPHQGRQHAQGDEQLAFGRRIEPDRARPSIRVACESTLLSYSSSYVRV